MNTQPLANDSCLPITAILLTYNEEANIEKCMQSICDWVGEIFLVDSGSTDRTLEIAKKYQARVVYHSFETHTRQWSWALENLPCQYEWVFCLDADQRVTADLRGELRSLFTQNSKKLKSVDGFYIKRRQIFRGRWIRYGGFYPKYLLKLFRRDKVILDVQDLGQHHFYVHGVVGKLKNDIVEDNQKEGDIAFWIQKHNQYAILQASEEFSRRLNHHPWPISPKLFGYPDQRMVWLRRYWYRLPLFIRPFIYFIYRYFLRLGFLDGKQGFIFHFLHGLWYPLLIDIHLDKLPKEG
ncbi:MAG: glycosyltransferase family 2 protein [Chlamydiae bacterium]|nr:glycosyltransferase family 2 protein [Chlamydiota bacterium]